MLSLFYEYNCNTFTPEEIENPTIELAAFMTHGEQRERLSTGQLARSAIARGLALRSSEEKSLLR